MDNVSFDTLRRNCAFKGGKLNPDVDKIVKVGTEKKIKPTFILRSFSDLSSLMPVQIKEPELEIPCENNDMIKLHFEDDANG